MKLTSTHSGRVTDPVVGRCCWEAVGVQYRAWEDGEGAALPLPGYDLIL